MEDQLWRRRLPEYEEFKSRIDFKQLQKDLGKEFELVQDMILDKKNKRQSAVFKTEIEIKTEKDLRKEPGYFKIFQYTDGSFVLEQSFYSPRPNDKSTKEDVFVSVFDKLAQALFQGVQLQGLQDKPFQLNQLVPSEYFQQAVMKLLGTKVNPRFTEIYYENKKWFLDDAGKLMSEPLNPASPACASATLSSR